MFFNHILYQYKNCKNEHQNIGHHSVLALIAFFLSDGIIQLVLVAILVLTIFIMVGEEKIKKVVLGLWGKAKEVASDKIPQNVDEAVVIQASTIDPDGDKFQITIATDKGEFILKKQKFNILPDALTERKILRHKVTYTLGKDVKLVKEECFVSTDDDQRIYYVAEEEK